VRLSVLVVLSEEELWNFDCAGVDEDLYIL